MREFNPTIAQGEAMDFLRNHKETFAEELVKKYKEKLSNTKFEIIKD